MKACSWLLPIALLLSGTVQAQSEWRPDPDAAKRGWPAHLQELQALPAGAVTPLARVRGKHAGGWTLHLPDGPSLRVDGVQEVRHANGDVTWRGHVAGGGSLHPVMLTEGREASFGQWTTPRGRFRFERWGEQAWLLHLDHPALVELPPDDGVDAGGRTWPAAASMSAVAGDAAAKAVAGTQIDVLFVYTAGFAARYVSVRPRHLVGGCAV